MPMLLEQPHKRESLNIRIKPELRGLIDRAAEEALLDRTYFAVDAKAYSKFLAKLDAPPKPNARLRRTMQTAPPWEK